jgi:hypothetical protein
MGLLPGSNGYASEILERKGLFRGDRDRPWDGGVPDPDFVEIKRMNGRIRRSGDQEVRKYS